MVPYEFQNKLIEECETLLKDIQTKNVAGETVTGVTGYAQMLPVVTEDEEDESQFFPYFIVRLTDGLTEDDDDPWTVTANIYLGVYDPDKQTNGHYHVLEMITRITNRFMKEPLLAKAYRAQQKMEWALQDEDTYPFYFGGIEIKFSLPRIGRSDDYS